MTESRPGDIVRQLAVLVTAAFQVYASYIGGGHIGTMAQEFRSPILPAGYAFAIWGLIFLLCGIYAIYQGLPAQGDNPLFRQIGWWTAGAFAANGLWIYVYTSRAFALAEIVIIIGFVLAVSAFLRFVLSEQMSPRSAVERWVVGPALGLLAGWLTAASLVGLAGTLIALGIMDGQSQAAEIVGVVLVLLGGAFAAGIVFSARQGPPEAWWAYAAAVVWALVAIIVEQRATSIVAAAAAAIGIALVLFAALGPWGGRSSPAGSTTG